MSQGLIKTSQTYNSSLKHGFNFYGGPFKDRSGHRVGWVAGSLCSTLALGAGGQLKGAAPLAWPLCPCLGPCSCLSDLVPHWRDPDPSPEVASQRPGRHFWASRAVGCSGHRPQACWGCWACWAHGWPAGHSPAAPWERHILRWGKRFAFKESQRLLSSVLNDLPKTWFLHGEGLCPALWQEAGGSSDLGGQGPLTQPKAPTPRGGKGGWGLRGADRPVKSEGAASVCTCLWLLLMKYNIIHLKGVEPWFLSNTMETRESTISVKNMSISNSLGTHYGLGIRFGITFRIQQWLIV